MPNIFTCDQEWFLKLKDEQPKVIVTLYRGEDDKLNEWLEKLNGLEDSGTALFVIHEGSCGSAMADKLGLKQDGETIVFKKGQEVGRLTPDDIEASLSKVKELAV
jgi:hypothetical protein